MQCKLRRTQPQRPDGAVLGYNALMSPSHSGNKIGWGKSDSAFHRKADTCGKWGDGAVVEYYEPSVIVRPEMTLIFGKNS